MHAISTQLILHYLDRGWLYLPLEEAPIEQQEEQALGSIAAKDTAGERPMQMEILPAMASQTHAKAVGQDWWFVIDDTDVPAHQVMLEKISVALGCGDRVGFVPAKNLDLYQAQSLQRPRALLMFGTQALNATHAAQETPGSFFVTSRLARPGLFLPSLAEISQLPDKKIAAWRSMQGFKSHLESLS